MILHFDHSLPVFLEHIQSALSTSSQEVIILRDVYGRLSCHLLISDESGQIANQIEKKLNADKARLSIYYAEPLVLIHEPDESLWEYMDDLAQPLPLSLRSASSMSSTVANKSQIRLIERLLAGKSWLTPTQTPFDTSPPYIITFYSFKGGVGRTTTAAMSALKIARQGHRVCMIDLDFEAPGLSNVTLSDTSVQSKDGIGVIDYLLERSLTPDQEDIPLDDYLVRLSDEIIEEKEGELWLMPAGTIDENYLIKLGRLDFQEMSAEDFSDSALKQLFLDLQHHRAFDYYVVDSRTGITDIGGLALNGLADLNVMLFGIGSQNVQGMHFVLQHLRPILEKQSKKSRQIASRLMLVFGPISLGWNHKIDKQIKNKLFQLADDVIKEQLGQVDKQMIPHDPLIIPYLASLPHQDDLTGIDYVQSLVNPPPYDELAQRILESTAVQS